MGHGMEDMIAANLVYTNAVQSALSTPVHI